MSIQRTELLAQVASWYYQDGEGLSIIAKRIGRSVSMVSRMLQEARDRDLVEIRINYPLHTVPDLERQIEARYPVNHAYVFAELNALAGVDSLDRFGSLCAAMISDALTKADIVGASWGTHVHAIARAMPSSSTRAGTVVQCSGALGSTDPSLDGARIAHQLAAKLDYASRLLPAPLIVDTPHVADVLRESPTIAEVLDFSRRADAVVIGVGTPFTDSSGLRRAGYLPADDLKELRRNKAAGDIMGYHLDADGAVLDIDLNRRVIGLEPASLAKIPNVVVAATGPDKTKPILAALRGGYVNTLLTDKSTAEAVLAG